MLRILLWKLGYEWACIKRILAPNASKKVYYFAFGANLDTSVLSRRRMKVYEAFDYALEGAALRFSQRGFHKDHGFASADPSRGDKVYGRMYLIKATDARRMDYFEGVPFIKAHDKVDGDYHGTPFYYYRAVRPEPNLKPTQQYLDYITQAYRKMESVPKAYVDEMEKTAVLTSFEPLDHTGKFIRDEAWWPVVLRPLLIKYEGMCQAMVGMLWNRSLVDWMIKH